MDVLDRLALMGRRYERRRSAVTGGARWQLSELLRTYDRKAILEMTTQAPGEPAQTVRPDAEKKLKISLLDMISAVDPGEGGWYEVFETAPSGDYARVRIAASGADGSPRGQLAMLLGRRTLEAYFLEDPILESINRTSAGQA